MPDENDLRRMFDDVPLASPALDATRIIARSRRRRLPRVIGTGAVATLAVAGIGFAVIYNTPFGTATSTSMMDQSAESSSGGGEGPAGAPLVMERPSADRVNLCEAPVAAVPASPSGLRLDVAFPVSTAAGTDPVEGTVRLTNAGSERVTGSTPAVPAITVSQGGMVLWHSNGPTITSLVTVDLEPGESIEYSASVNPVRCTAESDLPEGFPTDLPALGPGSYELSALIDFTADTTGVVELVSGPPSSITIG